MANTETGSRFNANKTMVQLVDPLAVEGLARVLTKGAIKYGENNWRKGLSWMETIGSLERHLLAIKRGEVTDPETGEQHIDHLGCNWMFLSNFMKTGLGTNDLVVQASPFSPLLSKE